MIQQAVRPIGTLVLALLAAPLAADAQPRASVPRIGLLYSSTVFNPATDASDKALLQGLEEHRYVVG